VLCRLHDVRCFSIALTITTRFVVSAGTRVVFVFGNFLLVIYPAHLLLRPTIPDKTTDAEKTKLFDECEASMESYASQFAAYMVGSGCSC